MRVKDLAKRLNITDNTWRNWKKTKPELVKLVELGLKAEESIAKSGDIKLENTNINGNVVNIGHHNKIMINGNDICKEICDALGKLPSQKQKKFYHKIMLEIFEELDNEN